MTLVPRPPSASSLAARQVMRGNVSTDTKPEVRMRAALFARGLRFWKNRRPGPGLPRVDVLFPRARLAVFIDGCFWHRCPVHGVRPRTNSAYWSAKLDRNVARDRRNDADLAQAGWLVLRVWEHEAPDDAAAAIESAYRRRIRQLPEERQA